MYIHSPCPRPSIGSSGRGRRFDAILRCVSSSGVREASLTGGVMDSGPSVAVAAVLGEDKAIGSVMGPECACGCGCEAGSQGLVRAYIPLPPLQGGRWT